MDLRHGGNVEAGLTDAPLRTLSGHPTSVAQRPEGAQAAGVEIEAGGFVEMSR
ncbi:MULTISPECIES: hypothetical protein [Methylobacteriaceae]|uniref:hypothetical protein n=1 Tax=Methylobacteriaceae TaxID=119045 RepID=UPI00130D4F11|nr:MULTISPECIES: hypothetical protein [Methylobacteriaceae]